jgi:hypothetical protein
MNRFLALASVLLFSTSTFAVEKGTISAVTELPSAKINCTLLFKDRGLMASLALRDGSSVNGNQYLTGTFTLMKNKQVVREEEDATVLISKDFREITVGNLYLDGLEGVPVMLMQLRRNDALSDLSNGSLLAFSGSVVNANSYSLDMSHTTANAACVFAR